jgi:mono/diheme cytochrome c family protein
MGLFLFVALFIGLITYSEAEDVVPLKPVPKEYADKHMPAGWWTDPKVIAAGQKVYEGRITYKKELSKDHKKCFECHGVDGKPKMRRAQNFRAAKKIAMFSDSYWFWRVSEGVPRTKMEAWKDFLTEEQIWQVIAYEHTFSHDGKPGPHKH